MLGISRHDAAGQRVPVNLGRTVVNSERPDVAIDTLDNRVTGDTDRSKDLQAAIDHPTESFRTEHLGHAGLVARVFMTIQPPSRMPNCQARKMQIYFIVGQHEPDALMFAERAAERVPPPGMFGGDGVATARRTEPAHAMGQASRPKPHLRVAKTFADLTEDSVGSNVNVLE